jgi:hypothetical protein
MKKFFLIYGSAICLIFAYATYTGWDVWGSLKSGDWGPKGQNHQSTYHK